MQLRQKTVRRLLILGGCVALVLLIVGTAWIVNTRKFERQTAEARTNAMAAYSKGDFATALPFFNTYLTSSKTAEKGPGEADVEGLLAYGKSRQAIPLPRSNHLVQAIRVFERYLQLKPGDREAQHLLLALYPRVKYNEEALTLAAAVLASDSKDVPALRARVMAFTNQRKYADALAAANELVKLVPTDLQGHAYVQTLMMNTMDKPGSEAGAKVVERYEAMLKEHPDDPRFEMFLARAFLFANNRERATFWLKSAAGRQSTDPEVAAQLTYMLERNDLFTESNAVLERLAGADNDAVHVRPLVRRLWQSRQNKEVLKRTEDQDPGSQQSDTDLLAYRALALYDLNRPADAGPIVDALAARKDDIAAVAWATAIRARESENLSPRERVRQYAAALERSPDNEVIHFFLGESYAALGESEPALQAWRQAAALAQSWAAPASAMARTLAATGRSAEALAMATEAWQRAPKTLGAEAGYIVAKFAEQQQNPDPAQQQRLLERVENVQAQITREPETLHIYAALLSRTNQRAKAIEVIKSAIAPDVVTPRETLLALASVSFTEKLGLEADLLNCAERLHGLTPPVAIRKAVLLSQAGKTAKGLELLEIASKQVGQSDSTQWQLAVLQYRESVANDENVLAEWVKLGDENPDNAVVQSQILRSPSRLKDKAFWQRTIDRLKKLTGEEAVTPRIERARWLLSGETSERDASEAVVLLTAMNRIDLPEIHRLLGLAHEKKAALLPANRDELLRTAANELEKAFAARNADTSVATELARVYRAMGRNSDAERVMSRVADRAADLGLDGRKRTARTLIAQGQLPKAVEVLEPIGDGQDAGRDALLASLYRRTGANDKAAALYKKILADERVEAMTIAEGADFFASRGAPDDAEKFLAKLRAMDVAPATRELLLASYAQRHGTPGDALKGFESAVASDPSRAATWQGLVGFHLRRLQFVDAIAAADRGLEAIPDEPNLKSLRAAVALQSYKQDASLESLADELSNDPQSGAITDMIRILSDARKSNEPMTQTVVKLRELADRNPEILRLQAYVAQGYVKVGQFDEAEAVALRASLRAPNDADSARLLTLIYASRPGPEKWPKVLEAARQWRQRSLDDPTAADLSIARALVEMKRPADAASQLESYVKGELKPESANPAVLTIYAQAMIRSGNDKRASEVLLPLAQVTPAWRAVWLKLATLGFEKSEPAVAWVEQVVRHISTDQAPEQIALADAWCAVGLKFSSATAAQKARAIAEPLTKDPKTAPSGWRVMSMVAEQSGEMELAVRADGALLDAQPNNPDLQNNLAYALLHSGKPEDLAEAKRLAEGAIAKTPTNSTYLDTLARIHLKSRDLPAAEQAFQKALDAQSGSVEAMIGLADVHAQSGRTDKARELLARINDALKLAGGVESLSSDLQKQLESVRQTVKSPVQSGRIE